MEPIQKQKVEDIIYERIMDSIRTGLYKEGEKLPSETELCKNLRVSRASIRGAMQRLKAVGRVKIIQGKGSFITVPGEDYQFICGMKDIRLTKKEFEDISQLREAVELKAVMLLSEPGSNPDLSRLMEAHLKLKEAAVRGDEEAYGVNDCLFHLSIINATGNDLFVQIASIFQNQYYYYFKEMTKLIFRKNSEDGQTQFCAEDDNDGHVRLYNCICEKRPCEARQQFLELLTDSHRRFISYLKKSER